MNQLLNLLITMLKLLIVVDVESVVVEAVVVEAVQSVDLVSTIKAVDCEYSLFCVSVDSPQ